MTLTGRCHCLQMAILLYELWDCYAHMTFVWTFGCLAVVASCKADRRAADNVDVH